MPKSTHISTDTIIEWSEQLSMLLRSGVSLSEALHLMVTNSPSMKIGEMNQVFEREVARGTTLSSVISRYRVPKILISLIRIGESSGSLAEALEKVSLYLRRKEDIKQKLISAATYPALIGVATLGVAGFLVGFIFPKIMPLFSSMNVVLPLPTRVLLVSSHFIGKYWWQLSIELFLFGGLFLFTYQKVHIVRRCVEVILYRLPLVGNILQTHTLGHIFDIISIQLQCGVSLPEALRETCASVSSIRYVDVLGRISVEISRGKSCAEELTKYPKLFPPMITGLLAIAERSGETAISTGYIARNTREQIERSISIISRLIEPLLMLGMGVVVGSIALSIIMPIYEITSRINTH